MTASLRPRVGALFVGKPHPASAAPAFEPAPQKIMQCLCHALVIGTSGNGVPDTCISKRFLSFPNPGSTLQIPVSPGKIPPPTKGIPGCMQDIPDRTNEIQDQRGFG
jgi:hypothetical protein